MCADRRGGLPETAERVGTDPACGDRDSRKDQRHVGKESHFPEIRVECEVVRGTIGT